MKTTAELLDALANQRATEQRQRFKELLAGGPR